MDSNFVYDHFQKTELARGEGKTELSVGIHCIMTSGKAACSARLIAELLKGRWVGLKCTLDVINANVFHARFRLWRKDYYQHLYLYRTYY